MKYYKDANNNIFAYELDGSQDGFIGDKTLMTTDEVEAFLNPPKTAEQIEAEQIAEWKASRAEAVASIKVTVNGKVFDGDETSQTRMARAIVALNDGESQLWVLADNTPSQVTKAEFIEALRLAGLEQTRLWTR